MFRKLRKRRQQEAELTGLACRQIPATLDSMASAEGTERKPGESDLDLAARLTNSSPAELATIFTAFGNKLQDKDHVHELLKAGMNPQDIMLRCAAEVTRK